MCSDDQRNTRGRVHLSELGKQGELHVSMNVYLMKQHLVYCKLEYKFVSNYYKVIFGESQLFKDAYTTKFGE